MNKIRKIAQLLLLAMVTTYALPNDSLNHEKLRESLDFGAVDEDGNVKDIAIKIVERIPEGKRYGVCHNYAITKILGAQFNIPGREDWHDNLNFLDYCEKVSVPQVGDLAIYKFDEQSSGVLHTGLVCGDNCVESKMGTDPFIVQHSPSMVPFCYGNHVEYHRLVKPKKEVIVDLQKKIHADFSIRSRCAHINRNLVFHADLPGESAFSNYWIQDTVERNMCADVNASNSTGQTLLMLAAKNNKEDLAKMLIAYGADVNRKDEDGNSALDFATNNSSAAMKELLLGIKREKYENL